MAEQVIIKYIRLSLDDGRTDSMSIENQRLMLDRYISESDMFGDNIIELVDNGYSGTNFERPAVQELLGMVRDGRVSCVIVKDFSRFGRNAIETGYFIERVFPLYGVRFISLSDGFDSAQQEGGICGLEVSFKFLIHEYYSKDLSKKISSARQEKARRGEAVTKNCVFGYVLDEKRNMIIDEPAADTVRFIFELYTQSKDISYIEKQLYERRRLTPSTWKKCRGGLYAPTELDFIWQSGTILNILREEQYIGAYVAGRTKTLEVGISRTCNPQKDWIRIPNHHPAIISQEVFDLAQERLNQKPKRPRSYRSNASKANPEKASPLEGKVICGHCGHVMHLDSKQNPIFHCAFTRTAPDVACHGHQILKSELEETVGNVIMRHVKMLFNSHNSTVHEIEQAGANKAQLALLRGRKQSLYESMALGEISSDEYIEQKASIDTEVNRLQKLHRIIQSQTANGTSALEVLKKAMSQNKITPEVASLLIKKVLIYPDNRVEINWTDSGLTEPAANAL